MSLADIRAALAEIGGLTAAARRHTEQAGELLGEAAALLAELRGQTRQELPVGLLAKARDDVAELAGAVAGAGDAVADLSARL